MKLGIFYGEIKVLEFDIEDYSKALQELNFLYEETEALHELKIIE